MGELSEFWKDGKESYKERCKKRNSEFEPLLIKAGAIKKSEAIYILREWICYPTKGFAMDKHNPRKRINLRKLLYGVK